MTQSQDQYVPGACNLGRDEVRRRQVVGWIGLFACVVLLAVLVFANFDSRWRLLLFLPAMIAALGFLQARQRFCVAYGFAGVQNAKPGFSPPERVVQPHFRRKDRSTSVMLVALAVLVGILVALAAYLTPV